MKNKITLFILSLLFTTAIFAQDRNCSSMENLEYRMQQDPGLKKRMADIEAYTQNKIQQMQTNKIVGNIITIPVVVHVIYSNTNENISDAQIQSQIDVLNEDYRRLNSDANNTWSQAADTQIEFCMSSVDPNGNATNGITRKSSSTTSWGTNDAMKSSAQGGVDPWDTSQYLNMWVCNIGGGILGYAQFPGGSASTDGVVISPNYFGSSALGSGFYLSSPFDLGRTTTHEVGHFLNLRHIWGDGNCSVDDFVTDTPTSDAANYGCATGHVSCNTTDMVENYMDYSDDSCMNLFTQGQTNRMRAVLLPGGSRASLGASTKCDGGGSTPTCTDGIQNGDETGVDCGGSSCAPCQTACTDNNVNVSITFDNYPEETSWSITNDSGQTVASGGTYASQPDGSTISEDLCLPDGCYTFTINDAYGDGICCSYGNGSYSVTDSTGSLASGGSFTSSEATQFCLGSTPDTTIPVITLNGSSTINLNVGDTYTEQGATASDNIDGDITANIVIAGLVNTNIAGTYSVTYNVSDAAGNAAVEVIRTVIVSAVSSNECTGGISSFPYSEGFENTLGAWTQSTADDINWTVDANGTPSSNTGPSSASQGTYYVYVEASSPNYPSKRAILNSPCFDLSALTTASFNFKYHQYGSTDMGTIDLELSNDNGATWTSVWNSSGNKGNTWLTANVDLSAYVGGSIQLRFNRYVGGTWQADIAIDDVSLTEGGSTGGSVGCTGGISSFPYSEGFENTLGAWTQSSSDDINWTVDANGTPSSGTGPSSAIQGSYYIYVEASGNGTGYPNKSAIINSPCYDLSTQASATFSFNYHQYGSTNMGTLDLEVSDDDGQSWTSIWNSSGNLGNSWQSANVNLSAYVGGGIQLRFNRVTGSTWQADIAIDNIGLSTSSSARDINVNGSVNGEIKIYPNPVRGMHLNVNASADNMDYNIYNMLGQIVSKGTINTRTIDVSDLESAIYIIEFSNGEERITKRFIKE